MEPLAEDKIQDVRRELDFFETARGYQKQPKLS